MSRPIWIDQYLTGLDAGLLQRVEAAEREIAWVRQASADELVDLARGALGLEEFEHPFSGMTAVELGNTSHGVLLQRLEPLFEPGTATAAD